MSLMLTTPEGWSKSPTGSTFSCRQPKDPNSFPLKLMDAVEQSDPPAHQVNAIHIQRCSFASPPPFHMFINLTHLFLEALPKKENQILPKGLGLLKKLESVALRFFHTPRELPFLKEWKKLDSLVLQDLPLIEALNLKTLSKTLQFLLISDCPNLHICEGVRQYTEFAPPFDMHVHSCPRITEAGAPSSTFSKKRITTAEGESVVKEQARHTAQVVLCSDDSFSINYHAKDRSEIRQFPQFPIVDEDNVAKISIHRCCFKQPPSFSCYANLKILWLTAPSQDKDQILPDGIATLAKLEHLRLTAFGSIYRLPFLKKLEQLKYLALQKLPNLEYLDFTTFTKETFSQLTLEACPKLRRCYQMVRVIRNLTFNISVEDCAGLIQCGAPSESFGNHFRLIVDKINRTSFHCSEFGKNKAVSRL